MGIYTHLEATRVSNLPVFVELNSPGARTVRRWVLTCLWSHYLNMIEAVTGQLKIGMIYRNCVNHMQTTPGVNKIFTACSNDDVNTTFLIDRIVIKMPLHPNTLTSMLNLTEILSKYGWYHGINTIMKCKMHYNNAQLLPQIQEFPASDSYAVKS